MLIRFPEDEMLGPSMATATMGIGIGVIVGPPFGGIVYTYAGNQWPFFILAIAGAVSLLIQFGLLTRRSLSQRLHRSSLAAELEASVHPPTSMLTLLTNRNIRRGAVALVVQNAVIASIEPAFPLWASTCKTIERCACVHCFDDDNDDVYMHVCMCVYVCVCVCVCVCDWIGVLD